jgi:hypothetical protein
MTAKREWLKQRHPLWTRKRAFWLRNERRYRGGEEVAVELRKFDWEVTTFSVGGEQAMQSQAERDAAADEERRNSDMALLSSSVADGQHYLDRQAMANYPNYPEFFMGMLNGHLLRKAPTPDSGTLSFGTLGDVRRVRDNARPTNAELIYFNVDGVGNDGSQWDPWWADVNGWAGATGHRWLSCDAPAVDPAKKGQLSEQDLLDGKRPYLVHHSPLEVLNWDYVDGKLAWVLIQLPPRSARLVNGELKRDKEGPVRLYVRKGFAGLDESSNIEGSLTYSVAGGWWTFAEDGTQLKDTGDTGTWEKTGGEIPMWPHFYQRDKKNMSRSATTELGNAAVAYMNLDSAANYDAWDAAQSMHFVLGVDLDGYNIMIDKYKAGSKLVPVPSVKVDPGAGGASASVVPQMFDGSTGAVAAEVFDKRTRRIEESVKAFSGNEVSGSPDSSGESKKSGFADRKSPRLALIASEMETSQNIAIRFLELRFGATSPNGSVSWTRDFDLMPVMDSIERMLDLQKSTGVSSKTLTAKAMTMAAHESQLLSDDKESKTIEEEFSASAEAVETSQQQAAGLDSEFGRNGTDAGAPPVDDTTGEPVAKKGSAQEIKTTEATVLNGAQVTSAVEIVTKVTNREIPRESGIELLINCFNLKREQAEAIIAGAGSTFEPKKAPEPGDAEDDDKDISGAPPKVKPPIPPNAQE